MFKFTNMFTNMFTKKDGAPILKNESGESTGSRIAKLLFKYNAVLILVAMFIVASIISEVFLSPENMMNILRQQSTFMLVALGVFMVVLSGGIDLSVNSIVAITSIMVAYMLKVVGWENEPWGLTASICIAILTGFLVGAINGYLAAKLNMPAFIVTLAMMYAVKGLSYIVTDANTILLNQSVPAVEVLGGFATGSAAGIPYPVILMIILIAIFALIMHFTSFGRLMTATGSNETAVLLAGINPIKYKFWAYSLCGTLCGVAGVIVTARTCSATALTTGVNYDMTAIASVVIGGASLKGGEGNVPMTVVGVFILAVIGNIMNLVSLGVYPQLVVKAIIIILAVMLKGFSSKSTTV